MNQTPLDRIFEEIFPQNGMTTRKEQQDIANFMLQGINQEKIALCEAGVGTGKTFAYLLASIENKNQSSKHKTVLISTSSIALQQAITTEYLPKLSVILNKNFSHRILKGKRHYLCEKRLNIFRNMRKNESSKQDDFTSLCRLANQKNVIDLDGLPLRPFLKENICVEQCLQTCKMRKYCRYQNYLRDCKNTEIDFLIVNHNYFVADVIGKSKEYNRLLPNYDMAIIDESHKLGHVLLDMYRFFLTKEEIHSVTSLLEGNIKHKTKKLSQLCQKLQKENEDFFQYLRNMNKAQGGLSLQINASGFTRIENLRKKMMKLLELLKELTKSQGEMVQLLTYEGEKTVQKLSELRHLSRWITWLENPDTFCFLPKKIADNFAEDYWNRGIPTILTSGTMSINGNYDFFQKSCGLTKHKDRIISLTTKSPFNYQENALLYLPKTIPFPDENNILYVNAIFNEIQKLIQATFGHTLILFSSYELMKKLFYQVTEKQTQIPLFSMEKGSISAIEDFRRSKNGVLFASDAAGEGIDLAGDILSSVIIVKLPFPIPTAVRDYELKTMKDTDKFKKEVVVPAMLTKLRQWIGRGIRTETDSCVFSILDTRATKKYKDVVLNALPEMPVATEIGKVEEFIQKNKGSDYFD